MSSGEVLAEDTREMTPRWTCLWELRHLLELYGLAVDAEYSDFAGSAPAYGNGVDPGRAHCVTPTHVTEGCVAGEARPQKTQVSGYDRNSCD